jgi:hypothetical protein
MARAARRPGARQPHQRRSRRERSAPGEPMPRTAAGSAVGADAPGVAVPPERAEEPGRRCGAWTAARDAVAAWRRQGQREPVGLASTGVSGLARCAGRAARGCAGKLGAAQHARHGPGRKTAVRDGPWRPALPPSGCLQGAWRPAAEGCGRRRSRRHRRRLVARAWRAGPQRQQAREQRPLPWTEVVSARHGKPGRARSPALLAGARAPASSQPPRSAWPTRPGAARQGLGRTLAGGAARGGAARPGAVGVSAAAVAGLGDAERRVSPAVCPPRGRRTAAAAAGPPTALAPAPGSPLGGPRVSARAAWGCPAAA